MSQHCECSEWMLSMAPDERCPGVIAPAGGEVVAWIAVNAKGQPVSCGLYGEIVAYSDRDAMAKIYPDWQIKAVTPLARGGR